MELLFILLWITAAILLRINPRSASTRWASTIAFFSGFGGLGIFLENHAAVISELYSSMKIYVAAEIMYTLSYHVVPYAVLMYGIVYSGVLKKHERFLRIAPYIFFLPVLLMCFIFPIEPKYTLYFVILSSWAVPYVFFSNMLLVYSYIKEKNQRVRQQRFFTVMILTPVTMFAIAINYIIRIFGIGNLSKYNIAAVTIAFILFLYASLRCGAMGIKLKFEKSQLDSSIKSISSGTAMLNHTIKNEIQKINLCIENIRLSANNPVQDLEDINENIKYIQKSTNYLNEMTNRIQTHTQEIIIKESLCSIREIVNMSLDSLSFYIKEKCVTVGNFCTSGIIIKCDSVHIQEVLNNIIKNSIESMKMKGRLDIILVEDKKRVILLIKDNGSGICQENVPHVFAPFFSTKKSSTNFGLGLSYCYNVMNKHGGSIDICSEKNIGTTVSLVFPKAKAS